jgi:hypothetical protein
MTAQGSAISPGFLLSRSPVCPAQGSPTAFPAGSATRTLLATGHMPAISSDILQKAAASLSRSRSSRTTLH